MNELAPVPNVTQEGHWAFCLLRESPGSPLAVPYPSGFGKGKSCFPIRNKQNVNSRLHKGRCVPVTEHPQESQKRSSASRYRNAMNLPKILLRKFLPGTGACALESVYVSRISRQNCFMVSEDMTVIFYGTTGISWDGWASGMLVMF